MKNYPKYVKTTLNHVIRDMAKHPKDFCVNPEKDFTRSRKLHFKDVVSMLVKMGGRSLRSELLDGFGYDLNTATASAFVQQRTKIKPEALAYLFHKFTDTCAKPKLYKGCQLLAVDGSDLQFTANPDDPLSYFPGVNGQMHYSFLHLNALYDLNSRIYKDAVVQKKRKENENAALIEMIKRMDGDIPAIIIADRGYESYHTMELIRSKGWWFLIRLREARGILSNLPLPEGDFDLTFQIYLTRKQNKKTKALMKENPGIYRFLPSQHPFPYLPKDSPDFYPISLRMGNLHTTPCAVLGRLIDDGITISCEGDMDAGIAGLVQNVLTGQAIFITDLINLDEQENTVTFWHCGNAAPSLHNKQDGVTMCNHPLAGQGTAFWCALKEGTITAACFTNIDGQYRLFLMKGQAVPTCRNTRGAMVNVKVETPVLDLVNKIAKNGMSHHWSLVWQDVADEMIRLAELWNIPVIEL